MSSPNKSEELQREIARRAYQRYCDRGCIPGADLDDWLAAEREVAASQADEPLPFPSDRSRTKPRRRGKTAH